MWLRFVLLPSILSVFSKGGWTKKNCTFQPFSKCLTGEHQPYATPKIHIYMKPQQVHNFRGSLGLRWNFTPAGWTYLGKIHFQSMSGVKRPSVPIIVLRNVFPLKKNKTATHLFTINQVEHLKKKYIYICLHPSSWGRSCRPWAEYLLWREQMTSY